MKRMGLAAICIFSIATLMAEVIAVAILWQRDQLTPAVIKDIRLILTAQDQDYGMDEEAENAKASSDDIVEERTMRILNLSSRKKELDRFLAMVDDKANGLSIQQQTFEKQKDEFDKRLRQLNEKITSDATEQARAILLKLPEANAVKSLMRLNLYEDVELMQGMPDKDIARILEEFDKGVVKEEVDRGQEIFKAISTGGGPRQLVDESLNQVSQDEPPK